MRPFPCYFITKYYSRVSFVSHYEFAGTQDKRQRETTIAKCTQLRIKNSEDESRWLEFRYSESSMAESIQQLTPNMGAGGGQDIYLNFGNMHYIYMENISETEI